MAGSSSCAHPGRRVYNSSLCAAESSLAGETWLEVHRVPREAWLQELEPVQQVLQQATAPSQHDEPASSVNVCVGSSSNDRQRKQNMAVYTKLKALCSCKIHKTLSLSSIE